MAQAERVVVARALSVAGRAARAFVGGRGEAMLLVHGGWGGAELHWSTVFEPLAQTFQVIAPDLPGFDRVEPGGPRSVDDFADWLLALLDQLGVQKAWLVGNSFGASVVFALAARHPSRCLGLVIVNGFAMPKTPPWLALLAKLAPARALLYHSVRRGAYVPERLSEAFHDPGRAPAALRAIVDTPRPVQLDRMVDALICGGSTTTPPALPIMLLWGASDRLEASRAAVAEKLARTLPTASLVFIARAGHCPQLEQPQAFVDALRSFTSLSARAR